MRNSHTPEGFVVTYRENERRHPQAPYRLEPLVLHDIETKEIYTEAEV